MAFDLPRDVVFPVDAVEVRLLPGPHPYETANIGLIEQNWEAETAANPALYDGQVTLLSALAYRDRRLVGACHSVRYATFMYWRRDRSVDIAENAFAQAVPVTSDGALVAARMGAHTSNAGKVYFAAGNFEAEDFSDGIADLDRNMLRELREETGLTLAGLPRDPTYHALVTGSGTGVFRRYYLPDPAEVVEARVRAFLAAEEQPELAEPVVIRGAGERPDGIVKYMVGVTRWHFGAQY